MTEGTAANPGEIVASLRAVVGSAHVLTGTDTTPWSRDWIGKYGWAPLCVARPGNRDEVSAIMRLAHARSAPVVPVGGNTGLSGGTAAEGAIMLSLDRMRAIREIRPAARLAIVEAGVVLDRLLDAAEAEGLRFPMTFGARGSAMIGGLLSTNAGGSNVLRYGNTRALCLGLEVVLADGTPLDLMSELHKDNTGYDLRDLFIGAEGTLGVITAAVLKLVEAPRAHATAMVALPSLDAALTLLNRLQGESGGAVEAFEYMPGAYIDAHLAHFPGARAPFEARHEVNVLLELASTSAREATARTDGTLPLLARLEDLLAEMIGQGLVEDAVIARSEAQRQEMWARREAAAELTLGRKPLVDSDIALPLDKVSHFLNGTLARIRAELDAGAEEFLVAHLGDGNLHYTIYPSRNDNLLAEAIRELIEDEVRRRGGSFSAEHGIGLSKLGTMARRKD
ncbi:MAG TPA: FAD-binding oxidoreductase, partial [Aliiroseovarius sp.]|nr:FAD-binding oxidoreductase [Aliiroseovarius sp.]